MAIPKIAMIAASAVSAVAQYQAGRAQAKAYEIQAKQAELQGKTAKVKHLQAGVNVLRNVRQNLSAVTAKAAAGNISPFSGSPLSLQLYAQSAGAEEFYMTQENAEMAKITADINAQQYRMAASQARRQGTMSALSTIGMGFAQASYLGGPTSNVGTTNVGGGGSLVGAAQNYIYPTAGSVGTPSMIPGG